MLVEYVSIRKDELERLCTWVDSLSRLSGGLLARLVEASEDAQDARCLFWHNNPAFRFSGIPEDLSKRGPGFEILYDSFGAAPDELKVPLAIDGLAKIKMDTEMLWHMLVSEQR